jgi:hypothetical protein
MFAYMYYRHFEAEQRNSMVLGKGAEKQLNTLY